MTVTALDRSAGITDPGQVAGDDGRRPDPEVPARARRRTFTAQYKQEILAACDAAPGGEKGAILRREGLYSSLIMTLSISVGAGSRISCHGVPDSVGVRRPMADHQD